MVPHFKRLSDFKLAKKWYMRALYMPGPERSDTELRMRRHKRNRPDFSTLQIVLGARKEAHKTHIRFTSDPH